jgi:hypothetical protein
MKTLDIIALRAQIILLYTALNCRDSSLTSSRGGSFGRGRCCARTSLGPRKCAQLLMNDPLITSQGISGCVKQSTVSDSSGLRVKERTWLFSNFVFVRNSKEVLLV